MRTSRFFSRTAVAHTFSTEGGEEPAPGQRPGGLGRSPTDGVWRAGSRSPRFSGAVRAILAAPKTRPTPHPAGSAGHLPQQAASRGRGTARRAVEGAPSAHPGQRQSHEPVRDLVEIRQDIAGGNAQNVDALRLEPFVTFRVAPRSAFDFVNPAVDLDRESGPGAIEVQYEGSDRMLPPEGGRFLRTRSQPAPQHGFRRGQIPAKPPGRGERFR